jgi:cell wall-associated NlpC family hydrolase
MLSQPARTLALILLSFVTAAAISGCAGQGAAKSTRTQHASGSTSRSSAAAARRTVGEQAAQVAAEQIGVPYRYGGNNAGGFDCSGLVQYAYANVGKFVPRTTTALWHHARPVAISDMQPGDILFFNIAGKMSHVGMYLGQQRFVHAPSSGREVTIARLDSDYYRNAFIRAGRP